MRLVGLLTSAGAFCLGKTDFCKLHQAAGWLSRCGFVWGVSPEPVWVCSVCSCSVLPVCVSAGSAGPLGAVNVCVVSWTALK